MARVMFRQDDQRMFSGERIFTRRGVAFSYVRNATLLPARPRLLDDQTILR